MNDRAAPPMTDEEVEWVKSERRRQRREAASLETPQALENMIRVFEGVPVPEDKMDDASHAMTMARCAVFRATGE